MLGPFLPAQFRYLPSLDGSTFCHNLITEHSFIMDIRTMTVADRDVEIARPGGRRAAQVAETRDRLIKAGAAVFAASGFHGASMADVARAAGMSQGAAYNHFAGKTAVFAAAFDEFEPFAALIDGISAAALAGDGLESRLGAVNADLAAGPERGWFDLLLIDMVEFDGEHWRVLYQRHKAGFARAAGRLEASGRLVDVGGAGALRGIIAAALGQTLVTRLLAVGDVDAAGQAARDSAVDLLLRGVLAAA
jgi:AcrR family transcriptional regulator